MDSLPSALVCSTICIDTWIRIELQTYMESFSVFESVLLCRHIKIGVFSLNTFPLFKSTKPHNDTYETMVYSHQTTMNRLDSAYLKEHLI